MSKKNFEKNEEGDRGTWKHAPFWFESCRL